MANEKFIRIEFVLAVSRSPVVQRAGIRRGIPFVYERTKWANGRRDRVVWVRAQVIDRQQNHRVDRVVVIFDETARSHPTATHRRRRRPRRI